MGTRIEDIADDIAERRGAELAAKSYAQLECLLQTSMPTPDALCFSEQHGTIRVTGDVTIASVHSGRMSVELVLRAVDSNGDIVRRIRYFEKREDGTTSWASQRGGVVWWVVFWILQAIVVVALYWSCRGRV